MTTSEPPPSAIANDLGQARENAVARMRHRLSMREVYLEGEAMEQVGETLNVARDLVDYEFEHDPAPMDAVELLYELIAVGAAMRAVNREPRLTRSEIQNFFVSTKWFFNSFWCKRWPD